MTRKAQGFTIAEVLVAIVLLSVGFLAVAGSSGAVTRMLAHGRRSSGAATVATSRMDWLRRESNRTDPRCTALAGGTQTYTGRVTETWTVTGTGRSRTVLVIVRYPTNRGMTVDTVRGTLECV